MHCIYKMRCTSGSQIDPTATHLQSAMQLLNFMNDSKIKHSLLYDIGLILVVLIGFWFRSVGLNWDENQHLHPDERFLTMVETALVPPGAMENIIGQPPEGCEAWGGYFDTACSALNPNNRGYGFFVYGTLPIFAVRYVAEWVGETGYDQVHLVGRQLSALADLLTIIILYFIVARVYNRKTALLAAAFSALAVLQIQQSHFFTVDTFVNLFMFLTLYFAVEISTSKGSLNYGPSQPKHWAERIPVYLRDPLLWLSIGFGLALGMAVASKINAAVLAILLPAAFGMIYLRSEKRDLDNLDWTRIFVYLVIGAFASLLAFRILQPYAFSGPGFFGIVPNETWVQNIMEQRAQASGDADLPFAFQWARRSHLYSFENLTKWGLGLPLGILAWAGFLWMGWRTLKGERRHLLLWGWTAFYFFWQSMQFNPTMRYQLPVYPLLAMMAAWVVFRKPKIWRAVGTLVLVLTALWAYAFIQIYQRPHTRVAATRWIYNNVPGALNLRITQGDGDVYQQPLTYPMGVPLQVDMPHNAHFVPKVDGMLTEVHLAHVQDVSDESPKTLNLLIAKEPNAAPEQALASATLTADFTTNASKTLTLDAPLMLIAGETYFITLTTESGILNLNGSAVINESSWDDGLPLRMDGYDGFGGLYQPGLNMEMYWVDDQAKIDRFVGNLSQGDYLFITSNRQWASTTRVPERYPLTKAYYEYLIGCPPGADVIWCYNTARPGDFEGQLGYELVEVFESFPTLEIPGVFHWEANDQFAEEAFTVYDHTKVLIFKKSADFDEAQVRALLSSVDISNVVHLTPKAAGDYEAKDLLLPSDKWEEQRAGGTWTALFDPNRAVNKYPVLGLLVWYFFVFILGLFTYPIVRKVFPGLADKGYPLARAFGLVLLAYFAWLLGSVGVTYSRLTIGLVFTALISVGGWLGWRQRDDLRREWQENRKYYLMIEGLFLGLFLFDLLIRALNPDLWHPAKGGERPMDLSYLHAVLKSTSFPPYDPWFAGGYINYYYYGFVLVGTPLKLLGLTPTTAYNYILPTLFAVVGTGAFSVGWNLLGGKKPTTESTETTELEEKTEKDSVRSAGSVVQNNAFIAGITSMMGMLLLGNLGTVRTIYQALQRIVDPTGHSADIGVFAHLWLAMQGLWKVITEGALLPLGHGDWYWFPSRVIPAPGDVEPITEFPLFTFLYSDLHAHMIVLPLTVLAIAWTLSFLRARIDGKNSLAQIAVEIAVAGLIVGAMRPTNTWDLYAYLPLTAVVVGYALFRFRQEEPYKRIIIALGGMALLAILSYVFYYPYIVNFGQAYGETNLWEGTHTPLSSYFTQWGLFLFVIVSWMWWETHEWMAQTPMSALKKVSREWVNFGILLLLAILIGLAYLEVSIGWVSIPLAFWAGLLILRVELDEKKRLILFFVGTGLVLTTVVEVIVLAGDIGRMNTVFKLYLQAWTLFSLSAAAAFAWLLPETRKWTQNWRNFWQGSVMTLLVGALMFTLTGTLGKIYDRVEPDAPKGLDGMAYMQSAKYWDTNDMELSQDHAGILWMRENIEGSPVIVEANTPEYRWGSRYTIYTGLPGVVGWNWHQRQQRALVPPNLITDRVEEIRVFYETSDLKLTQSFIEKYDVRYIVVGQVERNYYAALGPEKFEVYDGALWDEVFREGETVIYAVR